MCPGLPQLERGPWKARLRIPLPSWSANMFTLLSTCLSLYKALGPAVNKAGMASASSGVHRLMKMDI